MPTSKFDYIVIGSGASGCVVANRLSADPDTSVLLIEAGAPDTRPAIHSMDGFVSLWGSDIDWMLMTEEQAALGNRSILINQGKVLGGSTSINAMMFVRGNPADYDHWASLGNAGWGYKDVLPYFKKCEDYEGGASEYRGTGGPLRVRPCPDPAAESPEFQNGAVECGYSGPKWDYNGARHEDGAGPLQFNITDDGQRLSAYAAYIAPLVSRNNLTIWPQTEATKILFDESKKVTGIEVTRDGAWETVECTGEVIVAAGAFLTPKLLMLSGIGPAAHLTQHGIAVQVDLPGVGQNLQDHVQLPVVFRSNEKRETPRLLTGNALFTRTKPAGFNSAPDLQLNFIPSAPGPLLPVLPDFGGPVFIFLPILIQPESRGDVRLRSADPKAPPVINPNYLQEKADVGVFVEALNIIRRITATNAFKSLNGGELVPGPGDPDGFIRQYCSTLWHPAGTCKMGTDADAVVDSSLRVRGTSGLRVIDASVMPTVTSGNTFAPCIMIGEKGADMILNG